MTAKECLRELLEMSEPEFIQWKKNTTPDKMKEILLLIRRELNQMRLRLAALEDLDRKVRNLE